MSRPAFLFDLDGVVVDNMRFHELAWRRFFEAHGVQLDRDDFFRNTSGMPTRDVLSYFLKRPVPPDEAAALTAVKERLYRELYGPHLRPAAGLPRFLSQARDAGIVSGVGTGSLPENVDFVLDGLSLRGQFSAIVGAADVRRGKPDPETFLVLARRLGAEPERCVVFEDSLLGERAARAAGMAVVALTTSHAAGEFAGPDLAAPDFSELAPEEIVGLLSRS